MNYLIGIDVGTSATKTVLFDEEGAVVAQNSYEYPMYTPQNGWAEQKPEDWRDGVLTTVSAVVKEAEGTGVAAADIKGIGISGQMHGLVMLDEKGEVIRPSIIWCDQRTGAEVEDMLSIMPREKWIEIKSGQERSPCTIENYKRIAKNRLLPFFGDRPIDQITPDDIQLYFNSIIHLSKSYSTQSKALLKGIFDRAERMGHIAKNPMRFKYIRSKKQKKKIILQDDDLISVIADLDKLNGKDYLYACFLCFTALRRGEILGLRWTDIDLENGLINVRNNVVFPDGTNIGIVREPKDESYGIVHLQSELAKRIIRYWQPKGYVLPYSNEETDQPITRSMFDKMWRRINKAIDLKGATSHCFRATYATMMNAHCDHIDIKALQGALRHKTPDLAIRVYTKENENKTEKAETEYDEWLKSQLKQTS